MNIIQDNTNFLRFLHTSGLIRELRKKHIIEVKLDEATDSLFLELAGNDSASLQYFNYAKINDPTLVYTNVNDFYSDIMLLLNLQPVPPTATHPPVIEDGNTVVWYLSDDLTTITKDGSDFVSEWRDKLGSGHDLLQSTGASQPLLTEAGILFDGIDDFMKCVAFTLVQPEQIYMVFKQVTYTSGDRIFDGDLNNSGMLRQKYPGGVSPELECYAGSFSTSNSNLLLNTFGITRILFNGASSKFQINETTEWIGDLGAFDMGGFTLGRIGGSDTGWGNIEVKEIIIRKVADSAQDEQDIYDYLANKHNIS
jgi:hypothetical protein